MQIAITPIEEQWFALQIRSRFENAAAKLLTLQGFEIFLPKYMSRRNWSDRIKDLELPLFPGYLFCRLDLNRRLPVLKTPGVNGIVSVARTPIAVEESELAAIRAAVTSGGRIEPWPFMKIGDRVLIEEGPLRGLEGLLVDAKGKHRLVLTIGLLQRAVALEIDAACVRPLRSSRPISARSNGLTVARVAAT